MDNLPSQGQRSSSPLWLCPVSIQHVSARLQQATDRFATLASEMFYRAPAAALDRLVYLLDPGCTITETVDAKLAAP